MSGPEPYLSHRTPSRLSCRTRSRDHGTNRPLPAWATAPRTPGSVAVLHNTPAPPSTGGYRASYWAFVQVRTVVRTRMIRIHVQCAEIRAAGVRTARTYTVHPGAVPYCTFFQAGAPPCTSAFAGWCWYWRRGTAVCAPLFERGALSRPLCSGCAFSPGR